jgi:hypothetical protein
MLLFTINCSQAVSARNNNTLFNDNAVRSLTGLHITTFQPTRQPGYAPSQVGDVPVRGLLRDRVEKTLAMFVQIANDVDSLDICNRVAYAYKQSLGSQGTSLDSNRLAQAMDSRGDLAEWFTSDDSYSVCSFSCAPYDTVRANPLEGTGFLASITTQPTVNSTNPNLEGSRNATSLTTDIRHGVREAIGDTASNALSNAANTVANAGRSAGGNVLDAFNEIAGSSQLIKFAVYGLVIFAVVSASSKLIREVKS